MQTNYSYSRNPLDEEADRLLAELARDDYPHYSNPTFERRLHRNRSREALYAPRIAPIHEAVAFLQRRSLASIIATARLTRRQAEVFNARAEGAGWEEIARKYGHTRQSSRGVFLQAVSKIRDAWRMCRTAGIDEVYRQEVSRRRCWRR